MNAAPSLRATLILRGLVGLAYVLLGTTVVTNLVRGSAQDTALLHTLLLFLVALGTYAWVVFGRAVAAALSVLVFLGAVWAWGVRQAPAISADVAALTLLVAAAAWQRQRRERRIVRMRQVLEDLDEEQALKDQAIEAARQTREALQRKHARYGQLQSIAEQLVGMSDVAAIADFVVERAFGLIGKSDACLLFLVEPGLSELALVASKRRAGLTIRAKLGDQFDRHVLRTQRPLLVSDVRRDFRFTMGVLAERPVSAVMACPLVLGQRAEGVLRLDSPTPGIYTQDDLRFLGILMDLAATATANARLFAQTQRLAVTDGLTDLLLRRPFQEALTRELTRAMRSREPVGMLMLDVDHFKLYNDTFGHTAGDLVLKAVGEVLRSTLPADAVVARYGGEEFAAFLPRTKRPEAGDVAEAVRRAIERRFRGGGRTGERPVTVSVGVAAAPDDGQVELELIRVADQRLYAAKGAGRNQVCAA